MAETKTAREEEGRGGREEGEEEEGELRWETEAKRGRGKERDG